MEDNWENIADYLLRNRSIREMVNKVLNSLDEIGPDCPFSTDENRKHENKNNNKRRITKPDVRQKQRLLKEYRLTKYLTQERKKELARELNMSNMAVKNWFQNRRRREALLKRNKTVNKIRRRSTQMNGDCGSGYSQMNTHRFVKGSKIRHNLNPTENVGVPCFVLGNVNIKITEVKKLETEQNYQNNLSGFVVTQDENGICLLHEL